MHVDYTCTCISLFFSDGVARVFTVNAEKIATPQEIAVSVVNAFKPECTNPDFRSSIPK